MLLSISGSVSAGPWGPLPKRSGQRVHSLVSCYIRISHHLHTSCWGAGHSRPVPAYAPSKMSLIKGHRFITAKVRGSSVVTNSPSMAQSRTSIRGSRGPGRGAKPHHAPQGASPPCDYSRPVYNSASFYQTPRLSFYISPPSGGSGQTPRPPQGSHVPCASCAAPGGEGAGRGEPTERE